MSEWKEYKLGDLLTIKYGKDHKQLSDGVYPVYGSGGIMRYANKYLYDKESILIPRKGSLNNIFYEDKAFWTVDTMFWSEIDSKKVFPKFLFYQLSLVDFESLNVGSAVPSLTIPVINDVDILLPPLDEQKRIASILSSLDDKMDLLNRENATLEAMAETLFRQWFIEDAKEDWEEGKLGDAIEVYDYKRKPLSKMERDKMKSGTILYPYYGAAEIMDYIDSYLFEGEYILMGEDGTVKTDEGYPVLQYATGKFWPNNHAHILQAKEPYNNCFIWYYLKTTNIENIVTGAVQPKINQANMLSLPFYNYPLELINKYKSATQYCWKKKMKNAEQVKKLIILRDILLPKLMSNEIQLWPNFWNLTLSS